MKILDWVRRERAIRRDPNDYKAAWDCQARVNARDAILTGSTAESFERTGQEDAERLRRWAGSSSRVLNIGCGIGRVEKHLAPHVAEIWGVDISGEMVAKGRDRLGRLSNVHLKELALGEFLRSFPDASFDLVFSLLVLQHMEKEDAFRYLEDAFRVLKPGGIVFVQLPNFLSPEYTEAFLAPVRRHDRNPGRVRVYTSEEANHILRLAGFEVREVQFQAGREGNAEMYITASRPAT